MSNIDKIRNYTDKELAEFLKNFRADEIVPYVNIEDWLKTDVSLYDWLPEKGQIKDGSGKKRECKIVGKKVLVNQDYTVCIEKNGDINRVISVPSENVSTL